MKLIIKLTMERSRIDEEPNELIEVILMSIDGTVADCTVRSSVDIIISPPAIAGIADRTNF
uniref:Bm996 n=1 Tax=Brugia malayi TaxID=6279 RepID=A0A1I9G398_BRUMA|nr:Bm996 [Brugia malayi]